MGCWHGHGHGCSPGGYWATPRGRYGPVDEDDWYEEVNWPMQRRPRARPVGREMRTASLEARLEGLREELRHVEAALDDLVKPSTPDRSE